MSRRITAALLLVLFALPLHADFASIARAIDSQRGVKRVWIPLLGLARLAVRVVEPEGVQDFQLATFEGTENLDPRTLHGIIRTRMGRGFTPLVQTWSRRSNEWSFIYARPSASGEVVELIVLAHDGGETVLVRVAVDPARLAEELQDDPRTVRHHARK